LWSLFEKGIMTRVHLIGIGGSGLSAIARLLIESGYAVSGSDREFSPFVEELQKVGAVISIGHDPANIQGVDLVVRSSAIPDDNAEVVAALAAGIPVYKRSDFLGQLMDEKTGIAVAGTHGKTTTTAMIAWALTELGSDPSFIVGSMILNLGVNAHSGKGSTFVIEADEYDRMFLGLKPRIEIITNLEHDHPDCYPSFEDLRDAFNSFLDLLPLDGTLIVCADDTGSASLVPHARKTGIEVIAYTTKDEQTLNCPKWIRAHSIRTNSLGGFTFNVASNLGTDLDQLTVDLQVAGKHNVSNALAVLVVISLLGLSVRQAAISLKSFKGTGRRFEIRGESNGILIIDDYAHHPSEIQATLAAARARYPQRRLWAVWQPHTYSRTKTLFHEFSRAFEDADEVIASEIYAAREPKQQYSSAEVVKAMPHPSARFIPSLEEIRNYLLDHLKTGDVVLVLSAGDAVQVSADVLTGIQER
jgi:UDP-N-acetylmuramate--alanine ligase